MSERLVTARQVAELLGVTPKTVLRWTGRGLLPAIKLPSGAIRYRPEDLDVWLHEHETGAAERGVRATRPDRAQSQAYALEVPFSLRATRPHEAVENEEEDHAS